MEWRGTAKLSADLRKKANKAAVKQVVMLNGSEMQQSAMRKAPVDTGFLKRSIQLSIEDDGMTAVVRATADYAPYQEYGTRFMRAHPFMRPAFNEQTQKFKSDLERLL